MSADAALPTGVALVARGADRPLAWMGVFGVLSLAVPAAVLSGGTAPVGDVPVLLAWATTAIASAMLARLIVAAQPRFLTFTFWLFVYVWMGLAALVQVAYQRFPLIETFSLAYPIQLQTESLLVIVFGLAGYQVGTLLARRYGRQQRPGGDKALRSVSTKRLYWVGYLGLVLSTLTTLQLGAATLISPRATLSAAIAQYESNLALRQITLRFVVFVALYLIVLVRARAEIGDRRLPRHWRALFVALVIANAFVSNPISTARFWVGTVVLGLAFAAYGRSGRVRALRVVMAATLAAVIVLFPYLDLFRRDATPDLTVIPLREDMVTNGDFAMFSQVQMAVDHVAREGHQMGRQTLGAVLFFVPRSTWHSKPQNTGHLLAASAELPSYLNMSAPLWAELHLDGGIPLVMLGFALYGYGSRILEDRFLRRGASDVSFSVALVPLMAAYQSFILRGPLLGTVPRLAALVALLLIVTTPARIRKGRAT